MTLIENRSSLYGSSEWFQSKNAKDTNDKKTVAELIHKGAVVVLGEELANTARNCISPRGGRRGSIQDPLVLKFAPAFISLAKTVGFGEGEQFSYLCGLLYVRAARNNEQMKQKIDMFGEENFSSEECEMLRQLSYVVEMQNYKRQNILESFQNKKIAVRFEGWERLAEYADTQEES